MKTDKNEKMISCVGGPMLIGCAENGQQVLDDCLAIGFIDISHEFTTDKSLAILPKRNNKGKVVGVLMSGSQCDLFWNHPETYSKIHPKGVLD